MSDYILMTDSCCDLTAQMQQELDLHILPMLLQIGEESYRNWPDGREIGFHDFYQRIRSGETASTSAVSVGDFEHAMTHYLEQGKDVLYLCFSSGLSSTFQNANIAAEDLKEQFPDRTVLVVDTLCASMGEGLLVYLCAKQKAAGKSMEEVRDYAESIKLHLCHWFTVDDLNHLKRGGRISATTALVGTMLSIKPVMHVDNEGHLIPMGKVRGRKASLTALVDHMADSALDPKEQTIFISHGDCEADARFVADEITRRLGVTDIHINYIGPVIGSHSGPGTVALFFLGKER